MISTVEMQSVTPLYGYAGPCCAEGCKLAAEVKVVMFVNTVCMYAWVCHKHLTALQQARTETLAESTL